MHSHALASLFSSAVLIAPFLSPFHLINTRSCASAVHKMFPVALPSQLHRLSGKHRRVYQVRSCVLSTESSAFQNFKEVLIYLGRTANRKQASLVPVGLTNKTKKKREGDRTEICALSLHAVSSPAAEIKSCGPVWTSIPG